MQSIITEKIIRMFPGLCQMIIQHEKFWSRLIVITSYRKNTAVAEQTFSAQQNPGQACLIQIIWDLFRPEFSGSAAICGMLFTYIVLRLPDFLLQYSFIAFLNNTSQVTCPHRMSNPLYLNITLLVESQKSLYFQDSSCQRNCRFNRQDYRVLIRQRKRGWKASLFRWLAEGKKRKGSVRILANLAACSFCP